jgi:hypothetical protein
MELTEWMAYLAALEQEKADKNAGGRRKWND